jgi:hypothetical protein
MITNFSWTPEFWLSGRATFPEQVINEHRAMGDEAVVSYRNQLTNERVGLNPAALTNGCSFLYLYERSDEGFIVDLATVKVCWLYHGHVCAELHVDDPDCAVSDWIHMAEF